ncbi:MAG: hypothetical protein NTY07_10270 [Bacteroidia bacterium]|nr:hypothetical protein [Bacteroidia bacterium]
MKQIGLIVIGLLIHFGLNAQWPTYQKPDTIHIDFNDFSGDTLMISGYVAECGEFGGFIDSIKIYKTNSKIYGLLIKGVSCKPSLKLDEKFNPYNKTILIDTIKQRYILDYVGKFGVLAITHTLESNAPTEFWIQNRNKNYHRWDPTGFWKDFINLRDKLFKK